MFIHNREEKTKVGQYHMNLSPLALSCSRIPLVHGGVYYLPCGGGALVCIYINITMSIHIIVDILLQTQLHTSQCRKLVLEDHITKHNNTFSHVR